MTSNIRGPRAALEGRVALIAGAGDGIGRSCALALARDGADVVVGARTPDRLDALVDEIRGLGRRGVAVGVDVTQPDQVTRFVDTAVDELGRLDVVVNVAAWAGPPTPIEHLDADAFRRGFEVNVLGALDVSRRAVPHMRAAGGGAIVQISTLSAHALLPGLADYTATKSALETASLTLAKEVGPDGIRVNVVVPGYTAGPNLDRYIDSVAAAKGAARDDVIAKMVRTSALRRIAEPEDMAEAVLYLASPRARCVTGQLLHVNAGEWIG